MLDEGKAKARSSSGKTLIQCFKFYYLSFSYPSPTSNLLLILTLKYLCSSIRVTYWEKGNNQTFHGLLETNSESTRIPRDPAPSNHYGPPIKATAWGGQMIYGVFAKSDSLWVSWVLWSFPRSQNVQLGRLPMLVP